MPTGTVLQFPISFGIDEGTNPKTLPPGTLKSVLNVRFDKLGRTAKRHGTLHLSNTMLAGGTVTGAARLFTRGEELCLVDDSSSSSTAILRPYSATQQRWGAVPIHDIGAVWSNLIDSTNGVKSVDVATFGSLLIYAWVTGDPTSTSLGLSWIAVVDATGTVLLPPTLVNATLVGACRLIVLGGFAFVFGSSGSAIFYTAVNLTAFTVGSSVTLRSDASRVSFDACLANGTTIALVYENSANDIKIYKYTQAAGVLTSTGNATSAEAGTSINAIACASDQTTVFLCYFALSSQLVRFCGFNIGTLTETTAPTTLASTVTVASQVTVITTGLAAAIFGWTLDATGVPHTSTIPWSSAGGLVTAALRTSAEMQLCSKIFALANRFFVVLADHRDTAGPDETYLSSYLAEIESAITLSTFVPHRIVAKIDDGVAGIPTSATGVSMLPGSVADTEGRALVPIFFQATASPDVVGWRCGIRLARFSGVDGRPPDMWRTISIGQEAYYVAGLFGAWDGRIAFDYGMRPAVLRSATVSSNNGSVANGTYIYQLVPVFRSFVGVEHRGAPSKQAIANVANPSAKVTVEAATHSLDAKETQATGLAGTSPCRVLVEVYRSVVNASTPQKLTIEPDLNTIYNNPTVTSTSLVDTRSDAALGGTTSVGLAGRPVIYTNGGELPDAQPPAPYGICFHLGRIFLIPGNRRETWWSKDIDENPGMAPGFDATQRFVFEEDQTAILGLEDKTIFYFERGIQYTFGDGPDVNGDDNRFAPPRVLPSDVGCTNPRSLVMTPLGHFFQSERGIYLLSRSLELAWIGEGIRDTLAAFPAITSAVLVATENEIRFTANNEAGTAGRVLVYDYLRKQWLVRSYTSFSVANTPIVDACIWQGLWTFVTPTGDVYQEDTSHSLDNGSTFVAQTITFASIAPGGTISWSRVRRVQLAGQSVSNHQLSISIKRDFGDNVMQMKTFDAGSDATEIGPLEKAQIALKYQKTQAVEVTISDAAPANTTLFPLGTGAGLILEGVAFLVEPKRGLAKASNGRRG